MHVREAKLLLFLMHSLALASRSRLTRVCRHLEAANTACGEWQRFWGKDFQIAAPTGQQFTNRRDSSSNQVKQTCHSLSLFSKKGAYYVNGKAVEVVEIDTIRYMAIIKTDGMCVFPLYVFASHYWIDDLAGLPISWEQSAWCRSAQKSGFMLWAAKDIRRKPYIMNLSTFPILKNFTTLSLLQAQFATILSSWLLFDRPAGLENCCRCPWHLLWCPRHHCKAVPSRRKISSLVSTPASSTIASWLVSWHAAWKPRLMVTTWRLRK